MKRRLVLLFAFLIVVVPALCDDQQKVQKEITKFTAMAADFDGRRVVNVSMSEMFNVPRAELVQQRAKTGLNYGGLFLGQELMKKGMAQADLATKLQAGVKIADIANLEHLDWKQVMDDAKKLNGEIDKNLYNFFLGKKVTPAQDAADKYDVHYDGVKADAELTPQEIASAQDRYLTWKNRAASVQKKDHRLSYGDERVAYSDHVANGGPQGGGRGASGTAGTSGPVGMGGVPH
jgi:hypothetical protein